MNRSNRDYSELSAVRSRLGKMSDRELSRLSGVSVEKIQRFRNELNIPTFLPSQMGRGSALSKLSGEERKKVFGMLGKVPDRVVAERLGVSTAAVCLMRKRYGIAACPETAKYFSQNRHAA